MNGKIFKESDYINQIIQLQSDIDTRNNNNEYLNNYDGFSIGEMLLVLKEHYCFKKYKGCKNYCIAVFGEDSNITKRQTAYIAGASTLRWLDNNHLNHNNISLDAARELHPLIKNNEIAVKEWLLGSEDVNEIAPELHPELIDDDAEMSVIAPHDNTRESIRELKALLKPDGDNKLTAKQLVCALFVAMEKYPDDINATSTPELFELYARYNADYLE